ncbi:MAG: DUF2249 domain-containing protein [Burkholderiaceae bacterium]|nr:DUF2249 domain-containing protein [Burkholderiaceae bacterium]
MNIPAPLTGLSRVDVRGVDPDMRRSTALAAYRRLDVGDTMEIVDGRDPTDLYGSLQALAPGDFSWLYLQRGPAAWSVNVRKLSRIYSAGECCGVCGGGSASPQPMNTNRSNP